MRPFAGDMWLARAAVDAGSRALLTLLEVRSLGHATDAKDPRLFEVARSCRKALEDAAMGIAKADPHPDELEDANINYLLGKGPPPSLEAVKEVPFSEQSGAVFTALLGLPKGVKLLARFCRVMPATAAASPLLRATLETPQPMGDTIFHEHDESLHAAIRSDAFVKNLGAPSQPTTKPASAT